MKNTRLAALLFAVLAVTTVTDISAFYYVPQRRVVLRRAVLSPTMSLGELVIVTATALGLIGLVSYLSSESEAQKQARLERERQKLAMIAAMTPEQREVYYAEERLKIEQQKAEAMQQQANAVWWNTWMAPSVVVEPCYVVEEVVYY